MDPKAIPGYTIQSEIGQGGMAKVYLAKEGKLERNVALKVMAQSLLTDKSFAERFLREARILASLSHRNIVAVFDVGSHGDYHYMAMELLPGGTLSKKIQMGIPIDVALTYIKDIAAGLHYAAAKNFIHRDIKPENIMFAEDGRAVITDFGIAKSLETTATKMTMAGTVVGTPHYMSPEQACAEEQDTRSDLYSLGVMVYEILAGRVPFTADSAVSIGIKHLTQPPPPLPQKFAHFQAFIDKALAKKAADRFQTGEEMIAAIKAIEAKSGDKLGGHTAAVKVAYDMPTEIVNSGHSIPAASAPASPEKKKPVALLGAAAVAILVAGGAFFYLGSNTGENAAVPETAGVEAPVAAGEEPSSTDGEVVDDVASGESPPSNGSAGGDTPVASAPTPVAEPQPARATSTAATERATPSRMESAARAAPAVTAAQPSQGQQELAMIGSQIDQFLKGDLAYGDIAILEKMIRQLQQLAPRDIRIDMARLSIDKSHIKQIQSALDQRDFAETRARLARFEPAMPDSATRKKLLASSLADLEKGYADASRLISMAEQELQKPYSGPSRFGKDDEERKRFFSIYRNLVEARASDSQHPDLKKAFDKLEQAYISIIQRNVSDGKAGHAKAWQDDAAMMVEIPMQKVAAIVIKEKAESSAKGMGGF